ncbi:ABC transporter ATP-binding protein [Phytohabitans suffuscus]|uniref:High-affinity branched-chain amino acid transport ATP-binding protein n=1 Tax=Phytohabitans suffuscus TaxID=624315 RepID=A0A6F8YCS9_9ACTN|nr:ABC transporter ATP-binding protein [Phytohabitans suffuscus]BCB83867.1 high-affinity branched-chain amino acid transport ATP-binding protein [Phytohabitans suffuscus]
MPLLEIANVSVRYGAVTAVRDFSGSVGDGDVVVVLGANGAGKSSLLRSIVGLAPKAGGRVTFDGRDITRWRTNRISRAGIALVPEGRRIFSPLSVQDNLLIGGYGNTNRSEKARLLGDIYDRFPVLAERRHRQAGLLSGGEQQMLAFGRALMSSPRLMMMDEPSMGLAPVAVDTVMSTVQSIAASGIAVLMVEQNAAMAQELATSAIVMERGEIIEVDSTGRIKAGVGSLSGFVDLPDEPADH